MRDNLWATYHNGDFIVHINKANGTKIRQSFIEKPKAAFAENCDVTITTRCRQGCRYCYLNCNQKGNHADLMQFDFLKHLHPYTEIALNGNDLDHPQLGEFLEQLKCQKVFANITVNQRQFMDNKNKLKEWYDQGLVHGIGISVVAPSEKFTESVSKIPTAVLHVIAGIVTPKDIKKLMDKNLKLLILGYKNIGRGEEYLENHKQFIAPNMEWLKCHIMDLANYFQVISFDNKAIEQLNMQEKMSPKEWERYYMGDDGDFTFYLDLVEGKYGLNSMSRELFPIEDRSIDDMFLDIQDRKGKK